MKTKNFSASRGAALKGRLRSSNNETTNSQAVVYAKSEGRPLLFTWMGGQWWMTTAGQPIIPLGKLIFRETEWVFLGFAGGAVDVFTLTKMLATARFEYSAVTAEELNHLMRQLSRMGVTCATGEEPLVVELDVTEDEDHIGYWAAAVLRNGPQEVLFKAWFHTKEIAEEQTFGFFGYLQDLGIDIIII